MWQFSKLSAARAAFITASTTMADMRSLKVSAALAKVFADRLPLPSGPSDDIINYYNMTLKLQVMSQISQLGEICMIDAVKVRDLVCDFYAARYNFLYPSSYVFVKSKETALTDIFGLRRFISEDVLKEITENATRFMYYYNEFSCLVAEVTMPATQTEGPAQS